MKMFRLKLQCKTFNLPIQRPIQIPHLQLMRTAQSNERKARAGYIKWSRASYSPDLSFTEDRTLGTFSRMKEWAFITRRTWKAKRRAAHALIFTTFQWRLDQAFYSNTFSILLSFPFSPFTRKGLLPPPTSLFNWHQCQTLQGETCSSNYDSGESKHISSILAGPPHTQGLWITPASH